MSEKVKFQTEKHNDTLKVLLSLSNIPQKEVAKKLGISGAAFSNKVNGRIRFSAEEISVLADIFNVSADVLLGRAPLVVA